MIYLDYNGTTPLDTKVRMAMLPYLEHDFGNPSSLCALGRHAAHALMQARVELASLLGAKAQEVIFTSGATESIVTAFHCAMSAQPLKRHIVTSAGEHSATLNIAHQYTERGYDVTFLPLDTHGILSLDMLEEAITPQTALVSLLWANNETGVIFPIEKIAEITHRKNLSLHLDAVQAVGKIPINLATLPVDYLSLSGHKIYAPKGIGALYVHRHACYQPLFPGSQENARRGGTENVASCVALGKAAALAQDLLMTEMPRESSLRDYLEEEIIKKIPHVSRNGEKNNRLANTSNLTFEGIEAAQALLLFDQAGLCASAGSACNTKSKHPSHVLAAMGRTPQEAASSLRFSLGRFTTQEEIDHALNIIVPVITKLRLL